MVMIGYFSFSFKVNWFTNYYKLINKMIIPFHFFNDYMSNWLMLCLLVIPFHLYIKPDLNMVSLTVMLLLNVLGLVPYSWSWASYYWSVLILSILLFLMILLFNFSKQTNKFLSHLLPNGSPIFLWNILIILETISFLIRPITLSLRLTCNMMAGHIVLSLVSNNMLTAMLIFYFELLVSIIQSHIFFILVNVYFKEM
uniref:ATP synthase subunit a n=1 Tax=Diximermis spiculatus TaxID=3313489 RepID=Q1HBB9_9BILA|nr:ATP synthase F0 subunit 6 [Strelkovimermis spiculatus]ABF48162.1 ATP synthase F0 subunit 6 [Strelkovimermis spiculatus]ABF48174.1 ATP synthase F0 subunit 6 [Strelkovimermis spiculatus]